MDVSIIIVNWNTCDLLYGCLKSIYEQTHKVKFEVIVVDNNSSDSSVKMVRAEFPQVNLIVNDANRGLATAINQGLEITQARFALLLNSDTIICDSAIDKTVGYADSHQEAGIVGCQVLDSHGKVTMTSFSFPSLWNLFCRQSGLASAFKNSKLFGRERMLWWDRKSERQVDAVSGSFMLVRREAIDQVGRMDEDYFLYFEETDWCFRFAKAGWKIIFWPDAKIIHVQGGSQSSQKEALNMFVQFHKSLLIFLRKHRGLHAYYLARLMLLINSGLRSMHKKVAAAKARAFGKNAIPQQDLASKYWQVLKYCALGIEPASKFRRSP